VQRRIACWIDETCDEQRHMVERLHMNVKNLTAPLTVRLAIWYAHHDRREHAVGVFIKLFREDLDVPLPSGHGVRKLINWASTEPAFVDILKYLERKLCTQVSGWRN
jgi:hypothetical protein